MKNYWLIYLFFAAIVFVSCGESNGQKPHPAEETKVKDYSEVDIRPIKEQKEKATQWVASLDLSDEEKIERVEKVVADHLVAVRNWHNGHPYTIVPAGINPKTGDKLNELDRRMIAHSAQPDSLHRRFMSGLRKDLTEEQVNKILDSYTVGKVDFTMRGYHAIVPDLKKEEAEHIRGLLEQAREEAVDYKNMEEISAIFEIYKTKAEQYLNSNGRDWHQLYKDYVKSH